MASKYPSFRSFSAGEISPRMYARSDLPMYHNAVAVCENFNITPQGSAVMRRGWRYLGESGNDEYVRLLTFSRALNEDIVIELSENSIQAFNSSGDIVVDIGDIVGPPISVPKQLVTNGDFSNGASGWNFQEDVLDPSFSLNAGIRGGWLYVTTNATPPAAFCIASARQTIRKPVGTPVDNIVTFSFRVGTDLSSLRLSPIYEFPPNTDWEVWVEDADGNEVTKQKGTSTGVQTFTVDMTTYDELTILIYASLDSENTSVYAAAQITDVSAIFNVQEDAPSAGAFPWTKEQLPFIQTKMLTGQDAMILVNGNVPPYLLVYDAATARLSLELAVFTAPPPEWTDDNYPRVVEIFQGRLWLMSVFSDPSAIWGSKSGDLLNFTVGANADDALYLPLATDGVIQWAVGQNRTISVGTDLGENVISSDGPIITPSDASATKVSSYGSTFIQASMIGDQIMFVSPDARKLLATNYDDNTQNWIATELSWAAQHLAQNYILRFLDARNPDYQIVCGTKDGYWVQALYDRTLGLIGWQRNRMNGRLISLCVTKSVDGDIIWAAIKRGEKITINRLESTADPRIHLDYWVRRFPEEDANGWFVSGCEHLASTSVTGILDGAVVENLFVNELGVVRLPYGGSDVYIGLPYRGILKTLPEEPYVSGDETYSGGKRRNNRVTVRIVDSAMPLINGSRPADRSPQTPMDTREPNVTQDIDVRSLGWDNVGSITIEQDKPLRTEIVGIFTKLGTNKT